jgi:hypothetical protein
MFALIANVETEALSADFSSELVPDAGKLAYDIRQLERRVAALEDKLK